MATKPLWKGWKINYIWECTSRHPLVLTFFTSLKTWSPLRSCHKHQRSMGLAAVCAEWLHRLGKGIVFSWADFSFFFIIPGISTAHLLHWDIVWMKHLCPLITRQAVNQQYLPSDFVIDSVWNKWNCSDLEIWNQVGASGREIHACCHQILS